MSLLHIRSVPRRGLNKRLVPLQDSIENDQKEENFDVETFDKNLLTYLHPHKVGKENTTDVTERDASNKGRGGSSKENGSDRIHKPK